MSFVVLITPEHNPAHEHAVLAELFARGLERCHVRKPQVSIDELRRWIEEVPAVFRSRLVLHQHHELVDEYRLGGIHWRDQVGRASARRGEFSPAERADARPTSSCSCHDLETLRAAFGRFDSVFFSPVFSSISKPGYAPQNDVHAALRALLHSRTDRERRTDVLALGGITAATAPRALALGFDGVAALGAIWQTSDPVAQFAALQSSLDPARWIAAPATAYES